MAGSNQRQKVFCVGAGKTGTTSLEAFFGSLGFRVGDQTSGELLLREWAVRNFEPILRLAETAEFFQDVPFCCPYTFQALDGAFPDSKFILSVRGSAEEWFASLVRFHTKLVDKGRLPAAEDLRQFPYRYKGWMFEALTLVFGVSEENLYDRDVLIAAYARHNESVIRYFAHRPGSLLVVKLADKTAAQQIIEFVGLNYEGQIMPHLNRSDI
jgi:hypothetical protein